jgi:hypothetical protein
VAVNIPIYTKREAGGGSVSGYRQRIDDPTNEALVRLGQGVSSAAQGLTALAEKEKREQNDAAVLEAYSGLVEAKQSLIEDPENGLANKKGKDALAERDSTISYYKARAEAVRKGLANDEQRRAFDRLAADDAAQVSSIVDRHVAKEADALKQQAVDGALSNARNDAAIMAATSFDAVSAAKNVTRSEDLTGAAVEIAAQQQGWDREYTESQKRKAVTELHQRVISTMLDGGRVEHAEEYLRLVRDRLDADMLEKSNLQEVVREAGQANRGAIMGRTLAQTASVTVVRPWDPKATPIERVDQAKALAALDRVNADSNLSESAKAAAREQTLARVRESEAAWGSMLDDTYDRAITKLQNNGWRLSALAEEKAFLLSPKVEGGKVWESIVVHRENALRRGKQGGGRSKGQAANMVDFLYTLPQRMPEYLQGNTAQFMREWGAKLSAEDLEQAAGYISRQGVSAAKPDETLPPSVVDALNAKGGRGGFGLWDKKPTTPEQQETYLVIHKALLAKQQELKRQGKVLDDKTADEIINRFGARGTVKGSGLVWDDTVTRAEYESNPAYAGKPFVPEGDEAFQGQLGDIAKKAQEQASKMPAPPPGKTRVRTAKGDVGLVPTAQLRAWLDKNPGAFVVGAATDTFMGME